MTVQIHADEWKKPLPAQTDNGEAAASAMVGILERHANHFGGYYETFRKTIDLIYYALRKDEENYLKLVKTMDEKAVNAAAAVSGHLIHQFCYEQVWNDYLGIVYQRLAHNNEHMGQFFTPWNVAYMMAQMTLGDVKEQIEKAKQEKKKITLNEPSVGSGVMIIAAKRVIVEVAGLEGLDYFEFYGQDADPLCVRMAQIQNMLTNPRYMSNLLLLTVAEIQEAKNKK